MEIGHKLIDDIIVINLFGEIYSEDAPQMEFKLTNIVQLGTHFVINCDELDYIDSKGLGVLVKIYKLIADKQGKMALCCPHGKVDKVFEITRFSRYFSILSSLDKALETLR